eukprot:4139725-Prymnesium_polylepis.2
MTTASVGVRIKYSDAGGVSRELELRISQRRIADWVNGLRALLLLIPHPAPPPMWRLAASCMTATTSR